MCFPPECLPHRVKGSDYTCGAHCLCLLHGDYASTEKPESCAARGQKPRQASSHAIHLGCSSNASAPPSYPLHRPCLDANTYLSYPSGRPNYARMAMPVYTCLDATMYTSRCTMLHARHAIGLYTDICARICIESLYRLTRFPCLVSVPFLMAEAATLALRSNVGPCALVLIRNSSASLAFTCAEKSSSNVHLFRQS